MRIFDYLYYRVYFTYKNKWKDDTPGAYATSLVTLLQCSYLTVLIFIYNTISSNKNALNKIYFIILFAAIFIFNLYRYNKICNYKYLADKWDFEDKEKRKKRGVLTVSLIVLSLILFIGLATVLGKINQGKM